MHVAECADTHWSYIHTCDVYYTTLQEYTMLHNNSGTLNNLNAKLGLPWSHDDMVVLMTCSVGLSSVDVSTPVGKGLE